MGWGIPAYPPKETEHDTILPHKLAKSHTLSSSAVSSSTQLPAVHNMPGIPSIYDEAHPRTIPIHTNSPYAQADYVSSSSRTPNSINQIEKSTGRYFSVSKNEFLPNFVSDSVSPRPTNSADGLNHPQSNLFYQHQLELPSPSSSTSSQTANVTPNAPSSVPSIFGSYSPSPFTVSFQFENLEIISKTNVFHSNFYIFPCRTQPLLPNIPYDSAARCTLPSPTIFPPTPPPSAWNPFW